MLDEKKILEAIKKLDTNKFSEQNEHWTEIRKLDIDFSKYFLKSYPTFKKWQGRVFLVFNCIKYARKNESAFELGIRALNDRATLVRYRGTCILAYSLRDDAIPYLKKNLYHKDKETRKDAERAIHAIRNKNHHLFMEHRADKWIVNSSDDKILNTQKPENKDRKIFKRITNLFGLK